MHAASANGETDHQVRRSHGLFCDLSGGGLQEAACLLAVASPPARVKDRTGHKAQESGFDELGSYRVNISNSVTVISAH
jgi:hypothetical protein